MRWISSTAIDYDRIECPAYFESWTLREKTVHRTFFTLLIGRSFNFGLYIAACSKETAFLLSRNAQSFSSLTSRTSGLPSVDSQTHKLLVVVFKCEKNTAETPKGGEKSFGLFSTLKFAYFSSSKSVPYSLTQTDSESAPPALPRPPRRFSSLPRKRPDLPRRASNSTPPTPARA